MLKVGLTGGIACGKSYALKIFHRLGAHTIDSDEIARQVVEPGQPAYQKIVEEFGKEILLPDGRLDRKRLGQRIFSDPQAREQLNRIVHPYIFAEEERRIAELQDSPLLKRSPLVIVDAALMIETGSYKNYQVIIVVYCHPSIQLRRLIGRDGLSEEEAQRVLASQMPILEKIRYADYIIENSGKLSETDHQIRHTYVELVKRYEEDDF